MHIIPVIDLMRGQVVHARSGLRDRYQALQSRLVQSSAPLDIVNAYLALFAFDTLYLADLDAIMNHGDNHACLQQIRAAYPRLELWLDAGCKTASLCQNMDRVCPVLGSETGLDSGQLRDSVDLFPATVLSLDFHSGKLLGDATLLDNADIWPERVILMDLDRVGSGAGTTRRLHDTMAKQPGCSFYLAGGVQNTADIHAAARDGASGILMATALHDGSMGAAELAEFT
ncbi:MAG: HisA/HisF-related TIM barrel protein [Thiotrichales bacterium]|nr:HisA/HisF-related TIM barrel protein [Thiotrichales bacterium]